jgi:hypothetical protein
LPPTQCAIAEKKGHVARSHLPNALAGFVEELWYSLDRKNLRGQLRQQGCLIPRPGADLENLFVARQL